MCNTITVGGVPGAAIAVVAGGVSGGISSGVNATRVDSSAGEGGELVSAGGVGDAVFSVGTGPRSSVASSARGVGSWGGGDISRAASSTADFDGCAFVAVVPVTRSAAGSAGVHSTDDTKGGLQASRVLGGGASCNTAVSEVRVGRSRAGDRCISKVVRDGRARSANASVVVRAGWTRCCTGIHVGGGSHSFQICVAVTSTFVLCLAS